MGLWEVSIHKMSSITKLPKTPSPTLARKHCTRVCVACLIARAQLRVAPLPECSIGVKETWSGDEAHIAAYFWFMRLRTKADFSQTFHRQHKLCIYSG